MAKVHPTYPQYFLLRDERPNLRMFGAALLLAIALLLFIMAGLGVSSDERAPTNPPLELFEVPPPTVAPPQAAVIVPDRAAEPSDPSPPAPASPVFVTPMRLVVTDMEVASTELVPMVSSRVLGEGMTSSFGDGDGSGNGGPGGAGVGGQAIPPANLRVSWAPGMRMSWLREYYPEQALATGTRGLAVLNCEVLPDDRVRDCQLMSESPRGQGFGEAALAAQHVYLVRVHDQNGNRLYNRRFRLRALFYPEAID